LRWRWNRGGCRRRGRTRRCGHDGEVGLRRDLRRNDQRSTLRASPVHEEAKTSKGLRSGLTTERACMAAMASSRVGIGARGRFCQRGTMRPSQGGARGLSKTLRASNWLGSERRRSNRPARQGLDSGARRGKKKDDGRLGGIRRGRSFWTSQHQLEVRHGNSCVPPRC
jgi:hypothetical protein